MISPRFSHVLCSWIQNRRYRIQPDWWSLLLGVLGFFAFPSKTLEHYGSTKKSWRVTGFYRFFLSNSRSLSTVFIELDGNCMVDSVLSLSSRIIGFTGVVYGHVARWPRATLNGCFFGDYLEATGKPADRKCRPIGGPPTQSKLSRAAVH